MSDSITALGAQLAAAEAHVADLRARILGPSPIPSAEAPTGPLKAPLFGACEHGLNRLLGECPLCGLPPPPKVPIKLDLGCGPHKQEGHVAEAHVADLRARILGPSPIPHGDPPCQNPLCVLKRETLAAHTSYSSCWPHSAAEHAERTKIEAEAKKTPTPAEVRDAIYAPITYVPSPIKLDLGCGPHKQEGHVGVDARQFPGVDVVADLAGAPWPWADASVDSVHCSHMLEHVPGKQRIHFFNELYRVLKPAGTAQFITPHWASQRAYGDMTHAWPPVVPFFWAYLDKGWRATQAPHCDFVCDFAHVAMISPAPELNGRTQAYVEHAVKHDIDGGSDMHCTLTKRGG